MVVQEPFKIRMLIIWKLTHPPYVHHTFLYPYFCYKDSRFSHDLSSAVSLPISPHRKSWAACGKQLYPEGPWNPQKVVGSSSPGSGLKRICRTIPTNSSSVLWFNMADISMYLHLCFVASLSPSERTHQKIMISKLCMGLNQSWIM